MELANFVDCEDSGKKNALWGLAGAELLTAADFNSAVNRTASVYIKCPWNTVSALQKALPLSTDLLVQPIQLIIELNRPEDVFFPLAGAVTTNLPRNLEFAEAQFKQVHLNDTSKRLASRVDMNKEALTVPLRYFQQTTFRTQVDAVANVSVPINLTGLRQGSLKNMYIWALKVADASGNPTNVGNARNYAQIQSAVLSVNGLIYYDSRNASSQIWSLCDLKTPATFDSVVLADAGAGVASATPVAVPFLYVPFAQVSEVLANNNEVVMGLAVQNAVVNLSLAFPEAGRYVVNCSYNYLASGLMTKGSFEYIF